MPWAELPLGGGTWLILVGLGGLLALDSVSVAQSMVSRPLAAGTLGGLLLGNPGAGFLVGAILELVALRHPPYGAARYPDTGPASLIAGASFAATGGAGIGPLIAALAGGWAVGWIGTVSVHLRRRFNERMLEPADRLAADPTRLESRHRWAIRMDFARGSLITAGFILPVAALAALATSVQGPLATSYAAAALLVAVAASGGAGGRTLSFGIRGWPLLAAGVVVAVLLAGRLA